jgi:hypothetical protein
MEEQMNWRAILKNPTNQENKENQEYQDRLKSNIPDILGSEELKNEIFEQAKYLFFERLGISEDEELSFKEALNYINNQLTIN